MLSCGAWVLENESSDEAELLLEQVEAGVARLVGTDRAVILAELDRLMGDDDAYRRMQAEVNPYGDGYAGRRIAAGLVG